MKTLVISPDPEFHRALASILVPQKIDVVACTTLEEALEGELAQSFACVFVHAKEIDARFVGALAAATAAGFETVFAASRSFEPEWEAKAYDAGALFVFGQPLRPSVILRQMARLQASLAPTEEEEEWAEPAAFGMDAKASGTSELEIIRSFSRILRHAHHPESFVEEYLEYLKGILAVNKVALYLTDPAGGRLLTCAYAAGLDPQIPKSLRLSLESGIGAHARKNGTALFLNSARDTDAKREMEMVGAKIVVPVRDREQLMGVLLVGPRIVGGLLDRDQIELLFLLLQDLGLVLRNARIQADLQRERTFFGSMMNQMGAGCLVLDVNLNVLHVNQVMADALTVSDPRQVSFASLPNALSAAIYSVIKNEEPRADYFHRTKLAGRPAVFLMTVEPFYRHVPGSSSVLVLAHNHTKIEAQKRSEVENAISLLVQRMGEQFSHIFNNALTPISTIAQNYDGNPPSPQLQNFISETLRSGVRRMKRHIDQIYRISRRSEVSHESVSITPLLEEEWQKLELAGVNGGAAPRLSLPRDKHVVVRGSRENLGAGFHEVLLNAVEAAPHGEVRVTFDLSDPVRVGISFHDSGSGFPQGYFERIGELFHTTKGMGFGLGLSVAQKVAREHKGEVLCGVSDLTKGAVCTFILPRIQ